MQAYNESASAVEAVRLILPLYNTSFPNPLAFGPLDVWVTGHKPPDITSRSKSPVQWQVRIKPTESHIADLKAKFQDWRT